MKIIFQYMQIMYNSSFKKYILLKLVCEISKQTKRNSDFDSKHDPRMHQYTKILGLREVSVEDCHV
jgi:hypothetical protein